MITTLRLLIPFGVLVILGIMGMVCQVYVYFQLSKAGIRARFPLARQGFTSAFTLGWQNAKRLALQDIMTVWSIILGFSGITAIAFVAGILSMG